MKLYRIQGQSRAELWQWAGTQDDAKRAAKERGGFFEPYEVPTDKPNLLVFLNRFVVGEAGDEVTPVEAAPFVAPPSQPTFNRGDPAPGRDGGPRLWSAGKDNDLICEAIMEAEGNALARLAEAVAGRFAELAKEKIHG